MFWENYYTQISPNDEKNCQTPVILFYLEKVCFILITNSLWMKEKTEAWRCIKAWQKAAKILSKHNEKQMHSHGRTAYLKVEPYLKIHNCQCCRTITQKNKKIYPWASVKHTIGMTPLEAISNNQGIIHNTYDCDNVHCLHLAETKQLLIILW